MEIPSEKTAWDGTAAKKYIRREFCRVLPVYVCAR